MSGRPWKANEIAYLKRHYNHVSLQKIAKKLHRTKNSVQRKAQTLNLTISNQTSKPWTENEIIILEKLYEKHGPLTVAKKLNRTKESVAKKAQSLGLNSRTNDTLSKRMLAQCFNCDSCVISRWQMQYNLPIKCIRRGKSKIYRMDTERFWQWANEHREIIPFHKYERYTLLPEPDWLDDVIAADIIINACKPLTPSIRENIIKLYRMNKTWEEIAKETGRSVNSVKHVWNDRNKPVYK